tara:strand:- start:22426 stop:24237 length:1812 start_codon:yes stop_codon:yes gene_type:complete
MANNNTTKTEFKLPTDAYATFDATSLKSHIIDRLNRTTTLTDQNYEGSNMSAVIDIIAYSYHTLLFYLNQTSSEAMFTDAELYENMNRIVKSIDYNPVGYQTSSLSFGAVANSSLAVDTYTIPRYTFINAGGMSFSLNKDITFTKTQTSSESLDVISNQHLLYQGQFQEYPVYVANGEEFEFITLLPGDDTIIDHFNIHAYIKDGKTGDWKEWNRVTSLFLEDGDSPAYEVRLNENKRYEIKFGNNVNGKKLQAGDQVAVYYLVSEGKRGEVGPNAINGSNLNRYSTIQFEDIFSQIKVSNTNYMSPTQLVQLTFTNANASTEYSLGETVSDIRERAPKVFSSQHRLVTESDFTNFVKHTHSNVISDVKVVNNWDYIEGHMSYIINTLKLRSHTSDPSTIYNQVNFADTCDFNNVYVYATPKTSTAASTTVRNSYLTPSQKNTIIDSVRHNKTLTSEVLIMDPVYMSVDVGVKSVDESLDTSIADNTRLRLVRDKNSRASLSNIEKQASTIIETYFNNSQLGGVINVNDLTNSLLSINGVSNIKTVRTDMSLEVEGISLMIWNPIYPDLDVSITTANVQLPYFKRAYLNDSINFITKLEATEF